jgi:SEC-C motif domain protein
MAASKGFGKAPAAKKVRDNAPKDKSAPCGCGSGSLYTACCKQYHQGPATAPSPLELLRSRYTAYAYRLPDYIMQTTHSSHEDFKSDKNGANEWRRALLEFCDAYTFHSLEPGETVLLEGEPQAALLQFTAHVKALSQRLTFNERSRFVFENNRWLYVSGDVDYKPAVTVETAHFEKTTE